MVNNQEILSDANDLTQLLPTFVDSEHEIRKFCSSDYIDLSDLSPALKNDDFVIVQSINAKFDNCLAIINNFSISGHYFGATCLQ